MNGKTMDHVTAVETNAAARYVIGEMRTEERAGFEEHYRSCLACAEAVAGISELQQELRRTLRRSDKLPALWLKTWVRILSAEIKNWFRPKRHR